MFIHRRIDSPVAEKNWDLLKRTISKEKVFQATEAIGELAAYDMLELAKKNDDDVDRIYVKLRDGMPMALGMKKALPHVDVQYVVSQEKQLYKANRVPISFYGGYDGYSSDTVWFVDPINATGHTAIESLRFVRQYFRFKTALLSHVAANSLGIKNVQTSIVDFSIKGFMNYAHLSNKLDAEGYLSDGLELIPDYGDKLFGTLGADYSVYDIQKGFRKLLNTGVGDAEILKGTILHLVQLSGKEEFATDRRASWITRDWLAASLKWCCAVEEFPFEDVDYEQVYTLIEDLSSRDFLRIEKRVWHKRVVDVFSLTQEGVKYAASVYLPILYDYGIPKKLQKHFSFLIFLRPSQIQENIDDKTWEE
jgi:uracil phosphoribosyltransferase